MNILILSTDDHLGAGKAAFRMFEALSMGDMKVMMLVCNKKSRTDRVILYKRSIRTKLTPVAKRLLAWNRPPHLTAFNPNRDYYFFGASEYDTAFDVNDILSVINRGVDIVIFTWVSRFLSTSDLIKIKKRTGAVFLAYPLDMSLFTGGCHYAWDCKGYQTDCTKCPAIQQTGFKDLAADILTRKRRAYERIGVKWLAGSSGLKSQIASSPLVQGAEVNLLRLPINQSVFNTQKRGHIFDLSAGNEKRRTILFGATVTSERRKGFSHFIEALNRLKKSGSVTDAQPTKVMLMGNADTSARFSIPGFEIEYVGYINDDTRLSALYQSVDIFVNCSLEDSGPMMLIEAVLCGCVAVAYDTGVAPDVVLDGESGFLVPIGDIDALADRLRKLMIMSPGRLHKMSSAAAAFSATLYSYDIFRAGISELA